MSDRHENITPEISAWIREQRVFFVASAPLAIDGHINVSPKGGDSFRVLGPREVVYQDFTGSGGIGGFLGGTPGSPARPETPIIRSFSALGEFLQCRIE
jgi:hypothetical protein